VPDAWVIPGDNTANDKGFIDAMAWEEGEFTKPLYAHPIAPAAPVSVDEVALTDVAAERKRQRAVEGWTTEHDDTHISGEMARAAICYADPLNEGRDYPPVKWPWSPGWWKPKDRRRDLVRAAALITAEIERLDRRALLAKFKMEGR
jgi:hypothetical protein